MTKHCFHGSCVDVGFLWWPFLVTVIILIGCNLNKCGGSWKRMRTGLSFIPALNCVALDTSLHLSKTDSSAVRCWGRDGNISQVLSLNALRTMAPLTYRDTFSSKPHSPEGINVLFKSEKTILPYQRVFSCFQKCPTIPLKQRWPFLWMLLIDSLGNLANIMKPISRKIHTYSTIVCKSGLGLNPQ